MKIMSRNAALIIFCQKNNGDHAKFPNICNVKYIRPVVISKPVVCM